MTKLLTRRRFLQAAVTGGMATASAALVYSKEDTVIPAPRPLSAEIAPLTAAHIEPRMPIVLLINPAETGQFGRYLGEILRAEGITAFQEAWIDDVSGRELAQFQLAILGPGALDPDRQAQLEQYVLSGGSLIAIRPDPSLAKLLGIQPTGKAIERGSLRVGDHPLAQGITTRPLQFHGGAEQYSLAGAAAIANLNDSSKAPLITIHQRGQGSAASWAFDLGRSIAYTRQGNPALADREQDGFEGFRAAELFTDWLDYDQIDIPQADEQQRLFANVVNSLSRMPLPRLWYFPASTASVVVATGDAHGSRAPIIQQLLSTASQYNAQFSVYYTPPTTSTARRLLRKVRWWATEQPIVGSVFAEDSPYPTPRHVDAWRAMGHGFGMHPYVESGFTTGLNSYWNEFVKHGYGPLAPTVRTHRVLWQGWVDAARMQADYGIRMNLDYYHLGPIVRRPDTGIWTHGYLTGSGLPMRFVDQQGQILHVYQQHTHLVDEYLMNVFDPWVSLDAPAALAVTKDLLDRGTKQFPSAFGLQCHADPFTIGGAVAEQVGAWFEGTLSYAAEQGIPVLSAESMLEFSEARNESRIIELNWDAANGQLRLKQSISAAGYDLDLMVPSIHEQRSIRAISIDGNTATSSQRTVGGIRYDVVRIASGIRQIEVIYAD
ncbi:MAG: hypothetical protein Fur005_01720 [Roseiflexaceae bacterium]